MSSESSATAASELQSINNRYEVLKLLGQGGMGRVYLVEDTLRDNQRMALKTLLPDTTDDFLTAGFRDEFAELAKVRHPNLAAAFDFGTVAETRESFFTTEFISGVELMHGTKTSSINELIEVTSQLLRGLDFLHNLGLLHNDLKPANILLSEETTETAAKDAALGRLESLAYGNRRRVRLIDFGLICRENTACKKIVGTIRYISPERIRRVEADRRSDLYSIGAVLYTMFARRPPFLEKDVNELLQRHLNDTPPKLRNSRPQVPEAIERLISRLMEKEPEDRFETGAEALEFLGQELGWKSSEATAQKRSTRLTAGSLIHRDAEIDHLRATYDAARSGKTECNHIAIEGPSGVGKSRLVDELRGHVQVTDGAWVDCSGACVTGNLQPVLDAVVAGLRTCGAQGLDKLNAYVERAAKDKSQLLENVLEKVVLVYSSSHPLVLVVDDLDTASDVVRRWIAELAHTVDYRRQRGEAKYKLLMITCGHGSLKSRVDKIAGDTILLENFNREQAADFVRHIFQQAEVPVDFLETLVNTSRGNPLFLTELINSLVERREVRYSGSCWDFPEQLTAAALPASLTSVFEEKLQDLDIPSRRVLHWVSVAGHTLPQGVLSRCVRCEADGLDAHLESLVEKNLLIRSEAENVVSYSLAYQGSRELLDSKLTLERRQELHQRIAQSIEDEFPDWSERADQLAGHWLASGNEAGFLRFAPRAAALLRERGDYASAVDYHRRIAENLPETALGKKIQSLSKLAEMQEREWNLEAALSNLLEIERLGEQLMKPRDHALLLRRIGCVKLSMNDSGSARKSLERAKARLSESPGAPAEDGLRNLATAAIDAPLAWATWLTGETEAGLQLTQATRGLLQQAPPSDERETLLSIGAKNWLAGTLHQTGDLGAATELYRENLEALGAGDQALAQAYCATQCALGGVLLERGEYAQALNHLEPAQTGAKEIADHRTLAKCRERLGDYHLRFGRLREALQLTQAGLLDAERLENESAMATSLRTLGRVYLFANEVREAQTALERSIDLYTSHDDKIGVTNSQLELVRLHLMERNIDSARIQLGLCERMARASKIPVLSARCDLYQFEAQWLAQSHYNETLISRARATLESQGYTGELFDCLLAQIRVSIEARRGDSTIELFRDLLSLAEGSETPDFGLELRYFRSLEQVLSGQKNEARKALKKIAEEARNANRLRLEHDVQELIERSSGKEKKAPKRERSTQVSNTATLEMPRQSKTLELEQNT